MTRFFLKSNILTILFLTFASVTPTVAQLNPKQIDTGHKAFEAIWEQRNKLALKRLAPKLAASEKEYKEFLKQNKTGILFLATKQPCTFRSKNDVLNDNDLDERAKKCPAQNFQGEGQHFSFRRKVYAPPAQADISYTGEAFYSNGLYTNGLMVTLGDVQIDQISLESKGMGPLSDLSPANTALEADNLRKMIEKGFAADGFSYARAIVASINTTYSLRAIAYRVPWEKTNTYLDNGARLSPLLDDERLDIIVVFRVVAVEPNGITILWKELQRKSSPLLKT